MKKMMIVTLIVVTLISTSVPALAEDSAPMMIADVLIARPAGLVCMVVCMPLFIVALPFALTSGSVKSVTQALVVDPYIYTFKRPVGDFGRQDP